MERGAPTPEWLDEKPDSETADIYYIQAFWDLSTERQLGFTMGPIPESSIHRYPGVGGLSPAVQTLFKTVIRSMDSTYRDWAEDERKRAQKKNDHGSRDRKESIQ